MSFLVCFTCALVVVPYFGLKFSVIFGLFPLRPFNSSTVFRTEVSVAAVASNRIDRASGVPMIAELGELSCDTQTELISYAGEIFIFHNTLCRRGESSFLAPKATAVAEVAINVFFAA